MRSRVSAAFLAVVFDPDRMVAHKGHREPAMADTYTMILRPIIDQLEASQRAPAPVPE